MAIHTSAVDDLVSRIEGKLASHARVVIAIAGVPGAGKLTLVEEVITKLTARGISAVLLPQDGFHYYRAQLAQFDDPVEAFRRRGAPFTFDVERFLHAIAQLHSGQELRVPLFDHSAKDPVEDAIVISPRTQVVLVEGNYVGLRVEPWCGIASLSDDLWMVSTPENLVRERIIDRHLSSGIAATRAEAIERADGLDWQNAIYVRENSRDPDVVVELK